MGILEGKVAVISGGTSGIGERAAEMFVAEGAQVVIGGRRQERGRLLAARLGKAAIFVRTDVSEEADVKAMIDETVTRFGRVDCLLNNAGVPSQRAAIVDLDLGAFDAAMAIHLRGTLAAMKHAAPIMIRQAAGSIINTASINGIRAGLAGIDYCVAKAAVIHLTRCAAVELGEKGIRVNCISPGPIATGIFAKGAGLDPDAADLTAEAAKAAFAEILPKWQPLSRMGSVADIAQAALFLASDASSLMNGHNMIVDGGTIAGWPVSVTRVDLQHFATTLRTELMSA